MNSKEYSRKLVKKAVLNENQISRILDRLASQIIEKHDKCESLILIGVQRRGVNISSRLAGILLERYNVTVPQGSLDINLYRDDWTSLQNNPQIASSEIPISVEGASIILIDDVLFTGRTVRAGLEALLDYGRPKNVELLVLVDRGHRELPIHADYVGRAFNTGRNEHVNVLLRERDGVDAVEICSPY